MRQVLAKVDGGRHELEARRIDDLALDDRYVVNDRLVLVKVSFKVLPIGNLAEPLDERVPCRLYVKAAVEENADYLISARWRLCPNRYLYSQQISSLL